MNLYAVTVPVYKKSISSMLKILIKAEAWKEEKKIKDETLLGSRLAIDMLPFSRQIQILSDNSRFAAAALSRTERVSMEDKEVTLAELIVRLEKTLEVLNGYEASQFEGAEEIKVELPYFPGKFITGYEYVTEHALPNFFFHLVTAYDILRHAGLPIGKADYIGGLPLKDL